MAASDDNPSLLRRLPQARLEGECGGNAIGPIYSALERTGPVSKSSPRTSNKLQEKRQLPAWQ
jgi:hypothetical protein